MTAAIRQSKRVSQTADVASWSATFDSTTLSGSLLVVAAMAVDSGFDSMSGMTFADGGTNTFTSANQINGDGSNAFRRNGVAYKENATGKASHMITVTPTASGSGFSGTGDIIIMELTGIATSSALDGTSTAAVENAAPTATAITPTAVGIHLAFLSWGSWGNVNPAAASGWTELYAPTSDSALCIAHRAAAASTAQAASWTLSGTPEEGWQLVHVCFKSSSSGTSQGVTGMQKVIAVGTPGNSRKVYV